MILAVLLYFSVVCVCVCMCTHKNIYIYIMCVHVCVCLHSCYSFVHLFWNRHLLFVRFLHVSFFKPILCPLCSFVHIKSSLTFLHFFSFLHFFKIFFPIGLWIWWFYYFDRTVTYWTWLVYILFTWSLLYIPFLNKFPFLLFSPYMFSYYLIIALSYPVFSSYLAFLY